MVNLVPAIQSIEQQIVDIKCEYERKLKPLEESLKQLRKINETCERCNGNGKVLRSRACAEDDRPDPDDPRDYNTCPECNGTGRAKYLKNKNKKNKISMNYD